MNEENLLKELSEIDRSLSGILIGGQSNTLNSGGGSRGVTMPNYTALVKRKKEILYELACIQGYAINSITPGW
jgi:hypothetical protein